MIVDSANGDPEENLSISTVEESLLKFFSTYDENNEDG